MVLDDALKWGKQIGKNALKDAAGTRGIAAAATIGAAIGGGVGALGSIGDGGEGFGRRTIKGAIGGAAVGAAFGGGRNIYQRGSAMTQRALNINNIRKGKVGQIVEATQAAANVSSSVATATAGTTVKRKLMTTSSFNIGTVPMAGGNFQGLIQRLKSQGLDTVGSLKRRYPMPVGDDFQAFYRMNKNTPMKRIRRQYGG